MPRHLTSTCSLGGKALTRLVRNCCYRYDTIVDSSGPFILFRGPCVMKLNPSMFVNNFQGGILNQWRRGKHPIASDSIMDSQPPEVPSLIRWKYIVIKINTSLKRKCHHFDEIFVTGCTESCHFDNFRCSQWWKFHQNDDIFVSVV